MRDPSRIPTIESEWEHYREVVVPAAAGPGQVFDLRDAFQAGFGACLLILERIGRPDSDEVAGVVTLAEITEEHGRYVAEAIRRGRVADAR